MNTFKWLLAAWVRKQFFKRFAWEKASNHRLISNRSTPVWLRRCQCYIFYPKKYSWAVTTIGRLLNGYNWICIYRSHILQNRDSDDMILSRNILKLGAETMRLSSNFILMAHCYFIWFIIEYYSSLNMQHAEIE